MSEKQQKRSALFYWRAGNKIVTESVKKAAEDVESLAVEDFEKFKRNLVYLRNALRAFALRNHEIDAKDWAPWLISKHIKIGNATDLKNVCEYVSFEPGVADWDCIENWQKECEQLLSQTDLPNGPVITIPQLFKLCKSHVHANAESAVRGWTKQKQSTRRPAIVHT